jgi:hypothetical protein
MNNKPTIPEVKPLIDELKDKNLAYCCLHIVLSDNNISDSSVDYCLDLAIKNEHELCETIARKLLLMSKTQRLKLSSI